VAWHSHLYPAVEGGREDVGELGGREDVRELVQVYPPGLPLDACAVLSDALYARHGQHHEAHQKHR